MDDKAKMIKELRESTGLNRREFCEYFDIPYRTITEWERDMRHAPDYVLRLLEYYIRTEKILAHRSEVTDMVLTEFNEEEYIEMVKKECLEIGEKRGLEIGEKRGLEMGEKRGLEIGEKRGLEIGEKRGKKEIILEMIKEGTISPETGAEKLGVSVEELGI